MIKREPRCNGFKTVYCTIEDSPEIIADILRFRKRVLVDHLGWKLAVENNQERDEYDNENAVYCGIYENNKLISCFRLMRTDKPYLARDKFSFLATRYSYPESSQIWEISRLAVCPKTQPFEALLYTYSAVFHFAKRLGAASLVAFADIAKERLVKRIGVKIKRMGEPTHIGEDAFGNRIICVAGELPLRDQGGTGFQKLLSYTGKTQIEDAACLFGCSRILASVPST